MSSPENIEALLAPYLSTQSVLVGPLSTLSLMYFSYGIYCVIFGLSAHVLFSKKSSIHKLYKGGSVALFALATLYTATYTWGYTRQARIEFEAASSKNYVAVVQYLTQDSKKAAVNGIQNLCSGLMNSIADIMLIHRCYIFFNSNKYVLYPLAFAAFVLNGLDIGCTITAIVGFAYESKPSAPAIVNTAFVIDAGALIGIVVFQTVLTLMTGGRIWWITREVKMQAKESSRRTDYGGIIAVIIESALLYAATLIVAIVTEYFIFNKIRTGTGPIDITVIPTMMSGLAPTMVIARVAYGKSVDSVHQTLSTFRIADLQYSHQRTVMEGQAATIQLQTHHAV